MAKTREYLVYINGYPLATKIRGEHPFDVARKTAEGVYTGSTLIVMLDDQVHGCYQVNHTTFMGHPFTEVVPIVPNTGS